MPRRRTFLMRVVQVAGGLLAASVALPMLAVGLAPAWRRQGGERWFALGPLTDFAPGSVRAVAVHEPHRDSGAAQAQPLRSVYVWRKSADEVVVYSRACTDLGCPLTFDGGSRWFYCPCHGGIFSLDGEPKAGPPDRAMHRFTTRLRDGVLEIDVHSVPVAG